MRRARRKNAALFIVKASRRKDFRLPRRIAVKPVDEPDLFKAREVVERLLEVHVGQKLYARKPGFFKNSGLARSFVAFFKAVMQCADGRECERFDGVLKELF